MTGSRPRSASSTAAASKARARPAHACTFATTPDASGSPTSYAPRRTRAKTEIAAKARKIARNTARKDQRRIDPRTLEAAGYLILITSLDAKAFPPETLATLYRVRWQIELAFKRMKSILHLDRLPAKDPGLAK